MEGVKIVLNQTELDREVLASGVEDVLCFVFTSMPRKKPKCSRFGQRLKNNSKFRFLITAKTNDNYKGATIYHYKKGRLVTEDFQKPSSVETITDKRDLICRFGVYLDWPAGTLSFYRVSVNTLTHLELYLENTRGVFSLMKPFKSVSEVCVVSSQQVEEMASDHMNVAALGRPFTLGMLYDARSDTLVPGLGLWNDKTLEEKPTETPQQSSYFEISASDSTESKSSLLDIEASLKASFLGGLIAVGGSAEYLNDEKKFKNQSRVTFQYKATTNFKQLLIDQVTLDTEQMEVIEKDLATHVVTGILYGANAFFVFDSEKLEASEVQEIEVSMQAVINKIPTFDVEGKVEIKLTDEEKALTEKFSCKFYGDFILKSNPATFKDAVQTYVELPKLLGTNGENSVPVKVWLMPLKLLEPAAIEVRKDISID
ncbi:hypothetical protein F7725_013764 [Dissostichus mawsoni]|uniref:SNTX thioredoxin-like domain-containing protein n=1 Tax=Dissostichus mawsoni TaxID=36200 RepID=A0A7J5YUD5_DISMA|nr:hypothetical protein F7725_013764 [Dissostichus mawsoni]